MSIRCNSSHVVTCASAGLIFLVASFAHARNSQFIFDDSGNLNVQITETIGPPSILTHPQPQIVGPGALASFFVVVANTRNLIYQWRFNGTNIGGATSDALLLQNVGATNEGLYSVVLTNISGSITSAPAVLMLDADRDGLPDSWELANFGNLNQTATGDFDGDGVSNRDEFLDGTNPTNSVSARFRLTVMSDGGLVSVAPDQLTYTNGEIVTLTATSFSAEPFNAWTGDINTHTNAITLTMTNNKTVFAHFGPMDIVWTNVVSGDWHVASNWTPNFVPDTNDNAFISISVTVTLNSPAECAGLTLGSSSTSPTLSGTGNLTLNKSSVWAGGTMSGVGRTIISAGGALNVANASAVSLTGGRTLENGGTVLWTGANISVIGFITNRAGALFETQGAGTLVLGGGGGSRFDNAGTFRKSADTGTTTVASGVNFTNYGTVEIQTGTLLCSGSFLNNGAVSLSAGATNRLTGGGAASGTFSAPTTALVEWTGGTFTLNSGAQLAGGGSYRVNGGTVICNADVAVANLDLLSSTLSGTGMVTVNDLMNWTGGTMSGAGRTIISAGGALNVANASTVTLTGGRTLENGGTALWTGANISLIGVISNRTGAMFETQGAAALVYGGGGGSRFDNAGTFRKSLNTGTTTVFNGVAFNNYNAVEIQTGTLLCNGSFLNNGAVSLAVGTTHRLANGGSASGSFTAPATALVEWTGGTFTLDSGAQLNGGGLYKLIGGNVTCNTDVEVANLDLNSATLSGAGRVTVNLMNWTGGTMSGSGRTIIPVGGMLNVANAPAVSLTSGRTLENGGTVLWTGAGNLNLGSAIITNRAGALFHAQNAATFSLTAVGSRFDNAGTFRKSVNTGTTTLASGVNLTNYGTVDIRSGILAMNGNFASGSNAQLRCAIGGTTAGTGCGQLQKSGTVTLNGNLSVDLINGFLPATNDTFTVVTAGTRSGTFANFYFPSNAVTMQMSNTANSVIVGVTEVIAVSPPILHLERTSPTAGRLYWSTNYPDFHLEYNASLGTSNWAAWELPPEVQGANFLVTNSLFGWQKYYRLSRLPAPYTPPPPAFKLERASSGAVHLLWLVEDERKYLLQSSTNLSSANWEPVSPAPAILGWNNVVTNAISGAQRFYRLSSP